jgi:predicted membrane channel-forming protein YqfA (hemolysin III family)
VKKLSQDQILNFLLYAGAVYFLLVAIVHFLGIKIPGFFVYYNVPSHAYQDRIISFLTFGWSGLFFLTARKMDSDLIKLILVIGLIAVIALVVNTIITDFQQLDQSLSGADYKWIIGGLMFYWLGLVVHSRQHFLNK